MEQQNTRLRNAGFATFFFSGICAISAGVVVSLLQERYGFAYGMTGTLLSLMSVGNLLAGLLMGMLPSALGMKRSVLLLTIGYAVGYAIMGLTGAVALLAVAFFVVGIAKGSVINTCTILVSDNSADRTRGMNLMHSCYACGALLCPFLIAAAARVSTGLSGSVVWMMAKPGSFARPLRPTTCVIRLNTFSYARKPCANSSESMPRTPTRVTSSKSSPFATIWVPTMMSYSCAANLASSFSWASLAAVES